MVSTATSTTAATRVRGGKAPRLALRPGAGSVLALMMHEATARQAAVARGHLSTVGRPAPLISGVAVTGLLGSSADAFPATAFPRP